MTRRSSTVTIRDVADQAGVSVATVSRYINATAPVSTDVAARLDEVMSGLKYVPHAAARHLATQRTNAIGLLLTVNIYGDFFTPMLHGIEDAIGGAGFNLLISSNLPRLTRGFPRPLGPHNTDGLLVFANSMDDAELAHLHGMEFPLVLIHRSPPDGLNIPSVTVENKAASAEIVEHLIRVHNRRRIAYLRGPERQEDSTWREMGYLEALESNGLPFDSSLVLQGDFEREAARAAMGGLIASGAPFDGVFAGDDDSAVGALAALQDAGLRVPGDVSVVGFDDQRMSSYLSPPLTTVRAPTEDVGRAAAQQLLTLLRGGQADPLTLLPTEIVIRLSCGCQPLPVE
jgi:DNA-binding LacI/PurR family transcriptional regulator